jgi:phenylalanyl-tRNA synthetase beta chain
MRQLRGCVEALAQALAGSGSGGPELSITPADPPCPAYAPGACARVTLGGATLGVMGLASSLVHKAFDLPGPVAMADLDARMLFAAYPPRIKLKPLPAFPGTDRDLSLIVSEATTFDQVRAAVLASPPTRLERVEFVTTYRGPQVGEGKKSLTLRLCFRDPARTLRREEVDEPVAALVESLRRGLGAEIRS